MSCFNMTMPGLTQVLPQLIPLQIWDLQCYHIQPTARISLLAISPNGWMTSGSITSVLMKSRLQYTSSFGRGSRGRRLFLGMEFKNLLNFGKSLLKLDEIMWNSNYAQL